MDPRQKVTVARQLLLWSLTLLETGGDIDKGRVESRGFHFNEDVLGRTVDKLYRAGPEGIFMQIHV